MKNLILVFVCFVVMTAAHALISSPGSNSFDATGTIKKEDKVWVQVRNKTGSSIAKGTLVAYDFATYDDGATVLAVADDVIVPACMADEAIADGAIGKCLVYGKTDALLFDASTASVAGRPLYSGSSNANGYAIHIASASINGFEHVIGMAFDADSSSGAVDAFINLL